MNHSPVLFCDDRARGLHFILKIADSEDIVKKIKHGGGIILTEESDNSITLVSPDQNVNEGTEEVYSTQYIEDCCKANKILDLKPYRLNKNKSKYPNDFDVMDVFLKYTTWNNALKEWIYERCVPSDSSSDAGDNDSCSGYNSSNDSSDKRRRITSRVPSRKSPTHPSVKNIGGSKVRHNPKLSSHTPQRRSLYVNIPDSPVTNLDDELEAHATNEQQTSHNREEIESIEYVASVEDSDDESGSDNHNKKSVSSKLKTNVTSDDCLQQKSNQVKKREISKPENKTTKKATAATLTPLQEKTKKRKKKQGIEYRSDSESSSDNDQVQKGTVVRNNSGNNKHNKKLVSSKLKTNVTSDIRSDDGCSQQKSSRVKNKGNNETVSLNNENKASTSKETASDIRKPLHEKTKKMPSAEIKKKESDESSNSSDGDESSSDSDKVQKETVVRNDSGNNRANMKPVTSRSIKNVIAHSSLKDGCLQQESNDVTKKGNNKAASLNTEYKINSRNPTTSAFRISMPVHKKLKEKEKENDESSESSDSSDSFDNQESKPRFVQNFRRKEYTEAERCLIVDHINKTKAHNYVKGREFWMRMVQKKVVPGRTWQSLKEHYTKKIIPRIRAYNLSENEVNMFLKPYN